MSKNSPREAMQIQHAGHASHALNPPVIQQRLSHQKAVPGRVPIIRSGKWML
jgi:hypothetical protein